MGWNKTGQHLSPCVDCKDRKVTLEYNCHSKGNCPKYEKWLEEAREIRRKQKECQNGLGIPWNQTKGNLYGKKGW